MSDDVATKKPARRKKSAADLIRFLPQRYVERFPVVDLEDHPDNPKDHDIGAISESIDTSGFYGVVIAQEWPDTPHYILAGHGRKDTLIAKGVDVVPVIFVQCDPDTAARIVLIDNRSTELGGYRPDRLLDLLLKRAQADDFAGTGYDLDDTTRLLTELGKPLSLLDGDPNGETPIVPPDDDVATDKSVQHFVAFPRDRILEAAFEYFRARGFPYRKLPLHMQMQEMNRLAALDQPAALMSTYGYGVADTYHPHRLHATAHGKKSPYDSFNDDPKLKHALDLELANTNRIADRLFSSLMIVRGTQACSNFKPGYAMHLYRRFAPAGGVVLDPCTGYGGRLVGWLASQLGGTYIGCDPNAPTYEGNLSLAHALAPDDAIVNLHQLPFEDFAPTLDECSCDFAFTSPPYFSKERYSDDETQSWVRYPTIDAWRDGFLVAMFEGVLRALKPGGAFIVNIADVKIAGTTHPLEQMTRDVADAAGFVLEDTLRFEYGYRARVGKGEQTDPIEPAFVFRRPT